jgi:TRAP-type C4-dicarboxylate transport system permease small subunit
MAVLLAIICLLMFYDVVARYIFKASPPWAQELARYSMLYITFIGVSYGLRYDAHIKVDIMASLFPKSRPVLDVISDIGMLIFAVILVYAGIPKLQSLARSGQVSTAMRIPMVYVYMGLEIGWMMCLLRIAQKYILRLVYKKGFDIGEEDRRTID